MNYKYAKNFAIAIATTSAVFIYFGFKKFIEMQRKLNQSKKFQTLKYLLIGPPGVGKTRLFKKIVNSLQQKNLGQGFQECQLRQDIDLVYTPALDFENIDQREILIKQFSEYMMNNHMIHFFLLVNFERTDLMKKKILSVLKYFKKFKEKITIIVTDFQLSDNQEEDKQNLRLSLKIYLNQYQSIIFVENDFNVEELKNQLLVEAQAFSLTDTIFEPINEDEQNKLILQFQNRLNNGHFNKIEIQQKQDNDKQQEKQQQQIINTQQDNLQQQQQQQQNKQHQQQEQGINDHQIQMNGQFNSVQHQQ